VVRVDAQGAAFWTGWLVATFMITVSVVVIAGITPITPWVAVALVAPWPIVGALFLRRALKAGRP
jgi:hypothetical protein